MHLHLQKGKESFVLRCWGRKGKEVYLRCWGEKGGKVRLFESLPPTGEKSSPVVCTAP